jgi:hypothetical protein
VSRIDPVETKADTECPNIAMRAERLDVGIAAVGIVCTMRLAEIVRRGRFQSHHRLVVRVRLITTERLESFAVRIGGPVTSHDGCVVSGLLEDVVAHWRLVFSSEAVAAITSCTAFQLVACILASEVALHLGEEVPGVLT